MLKKTAEVNAPKHAKVNAKVIAKKVSAKKMLR
jgi:hypothetical protein